MIKQSLFFKWLNMMHNCFNLSYFEIFLIDIPNSFFAEAAATFD